MRIREVTSGYEILKGGKKRGKLPVYAVFGYQPGVGDERDAVRIKYNEEADEGSLPQLGTYKEMQHMILENAPESFAFNDERKLIYSLVETKSFRYIEELSEIPRHPFSGYYSEGLSEFFFGVDIDAAGKQLDRDSAAFLSRYTPKKQVSSLLIPDLLSGEALCIGEFHDEPHARDFFIYNMRLLKSLGYDTLYLENLAYDSLYQDLLDQYQSSPIDSDDMPRSLELMIKSFADEKEGGRKVFYELIKTAKDCGVRVVGIDTVAAHEKKGDDPKRYSRLTYTSLKIIEKEESLRTKPGKYMLLIGNNHITESFKTPGIPYLLGIHSLSVRGSDESRRLVYAPDGTRIEKSRFSRDKSNKTPTAVCCKNNLIVIEEIEKSLIAEARSGDKSTDPTQSADPTQRKYSLVFQKKEIKDGKPRPVIKDAEAWKTAKLASCAIL